MQESSTDFIASVGLGNVDCCWTTVSSILVLCTMCRESKAPNLQPKEIALPQLLSAMLSKQRGICIIGANILARRLGANTYVYGRS